jgi:hypothetical protein
MPVAFGVGAPERQAEAGLVGSPAGMRAAARARLRRARAMARGQGGRPGYRRPRRRVLLRTQIEAGHLGREGIHVAQLLAGMLGEGPGGGAGRP